LFVCKAKKFLKGNGFLFLGYHLIKGFPLASLVDKTSKNNARRRNGKKLLSVISINFIFTCHFNQNDIIASGNKRLLEIGQITKF